MRQLLDTSAYARILGDELRRLRQQRGWTRRDLRKRVPGDLSLQTLATYELGTRACTTARLVEICLALDELPHELLARVHRRVFPADLDTGLHLNLHAVAYAQTPQLQPLRRWAAHHLNHHPTPRNAAITLDQTAIEQLAILCNTTVPDLLTHLHPLLTSPELVP